MNNKPTPYELFFAGTISLVSYALFGMLAWNFSMPQIWGLQEMNFFEMVCTVFVFRTFVVTHAKSSYELTSKEMWSSLFVSVSLSGVFCLLVFFASFAI